MKWEGNEPQRERDVQTRPDIINQPRHYTLGIECWDYIVSHDMGFLEGNVIKYVTRYRYKGRPLEDLKKARAYLERLIRQYEPTTEKG
jgi:hypothetical protein